MAEFCIEIAGRVAAVHSLFASTRDYCRAYLTPKAPDTLLSVSREDLATEQEYLYAEARQEGIRLNYIDTDDDIPEIPCDPKRMRQVFLNILDNAAKHGGDGKIIDATIRCTDIAVIITIRDYGPGIPEDEIPLVKKKFYKGSSKARGTGIGLAVCDEIVTMHDGSLDIANAEGGGTQVRICLPLEQ